MKQIVAAVAVALSLGIAAVGDAEAKRLGGGKSSGMQRQNVTAPAQTPGSPAQAPGAASATQAPAAAAAAAPAAAAARSGASRWLGPVAGLAAGLGLAALASHLGFGEELASVMLLVVLAVVVLGVIGFVMRKRMGTPSPAMAGGAPAYRMPQPMQPAQPQQPWQGSTRIGSALAAAAEQGRPFPADFDVAGFARNAESNFLALQAANDAGDLQRLREFLSDELLMQARQEIAERAGQPQKTEVYGLQAQVLQVVEESAEWIASVRFTGRIRQEAGAQPEDFDETWHLTKPRSGAGGWVLAGIQQAG